MERGVNFDFSSPAAAKAMRDMSNYLGIQEDEAHMLWIAELAITSPLPRDWVEAVNEEGGTYYVHQVTKKTCWEHPRDDYFKRLVARNRKKLASRVAVLSEQGDFQFDAAGCGEGVALTPDLKSARNERVQGYPSFRMKNCLSSGVRAIQIEIDSLPEMGFISFGVGPKYFSDNDECIPTEQFRYICYTSVGETYNFGSLNSKGLQRVGQGDTVLMIINFPAKRVVWYKNSHPVGFVEKCDLRDVYPCFVFGAEGYKISCSPAQELPHDLMKWCTRNKHRFVEVVSSSLDLLAKSTANSGYATVRTVAPFSEGMPFFEIELTAVPPDGYILLGIGGPDSYQNNDAVPDDIFGCFGYSSQGQSFALGKLEQHHLPRYGQGDRVGFQIDFERNKAAFYVNGLPACELSNLTEKEDFWPFVVFGSLGYAVKLNPTPSMPLGITRWIPDELDPPRYTTYSDHFGLRSDDSKEVVVARSTVLYEKGKHYFEISVESASDDAQIMLGCAFPSVVESYLFIPEELHHHVGMTSRGEIVLFSEIVASDCSKVFVGDTMGISLDLDANTAIFYRNGNPVYRTEDRRLLGSFTPTLHAVGKFTVSLTPTPRIPQGVPSWSSTFRQEPISILKDGLTVEMPEGDITRTIWASTVYSFGVVYVEFSIELLHRDGKITLGFGNRNFCNSATALPYEEYFVLGYDCRGNILSKGKFIKEGMIPYGNGDLIGMMLNFEKETLTIYKNGHPEIVVDAPGVSVGVSPTATFTKGPHSVRLVPMPRVPPPSPRWDVQVSHKSAIVSNFGLTALSGTASGTPMAMSTYVFERGIGYIEIVIDFLPESAYMNVGIAVKGAHESADRILKPDCKHICYTSIGEVYNMGKRVSNDLEDFTTGDRMGLLVNMDAGSITFIRNGHPVAFQTGITCAVRPCVCFGYKNYQVSIDASAKMPLLGAPRWDPVHRHKELKLSRDYMTVVNKTFMASPTLRATTAFTSGANYFEVRVVEVNLGGHIAFGLGNEEVYKNTAVLAPPQYNFYSYTSSGVIMVKGKKHIEDVEKYTKGDFIGFKYDVDSRFIIFYRNRKPIAEIEDVDEGLYPAMTFGNEKFSATIQPNARQRLEVPAFDGQSCPDELELYHYNSTCVNASKTGFPTVRTMQAFRTGTFFLEVNVDHLEEGGWMLVGVASVICVRNKQNIPPERFNSYAYASSGEIFALGERQGEPKTKFNKGDAVGFLCNLDTRGIIFYINGEQAGEVNDLAPHVEYVPMVSFGHGPFQVTINKVPTIQKLFAQSDRLFKKQDSS